MNDFTLVCPWCHTTVDTQNPGSCPGIREHSQDLDDREFAA